MTWSFISFDRDQVIHDLDDLLENTHHIGVQQVDQLCQVRATRGLLLYKWRHYLFVLF